MKPLWGIDLGGTKIEGVVIESREHPRELARLRIPTEAGEGYLHIVQQVNKLITALEKETGLKPERIGIGTPGVLEPSTLTMKNCNTTALNGKPFKTDLEAVTGLPVKMANDANCFAIAEACLGAGKPFLQESEVIFGVIMGTGVGGGIVIDGKAITGLQGIAGEWGHNFLDESGGPCYCGRSGCVETILSGPSLERYYACISGEKLPLKEIVALYRQGFEHACATMQRMNHFFGKAIANVINIVDPHLIILGGGLGNIDLLYTEGIKSVEKFIFNPRLETRFLKPELGDSAGVFGAALL
ncbi:N-acetylglucosamine kinase [Anseongella ginsenosidimutans]|uniref:N-acetylglucosamine kinase n=1 Tax=Anseongella ginsenosidimutans TaxID=496056 RepID=A0A4R3KKC9_9SPHI|nr:ROK family protein [Anseongella ginsenosidimutans]QEC51496.1 ROK family protein [Anseongella ginsenosidimutans]TCS84325.1 N-acetylglucosamine kinase [Anseongella ginsenosidimutans]